MLRRFFSHVWPFLVVDAFAVVLLAVLIMGTPVRAEDSPVEDAGGTAAAQSDPDSEGGAVDGSKEESGQESIFSTFDEIDKAAMMGLLEGKSVVAVGSSGHDVYLETVDGDRYWYADEDGDVLVYMKFAGYEITGLGALPVDHSSESDGSAQVKATDADAVILRIIGLGMVMFAISMVVRVYKIRREGEMRFTQVAVGPAKDSSKQQQGKQDVPRVRFDDVEGVDELKQDVMRLVDCLKDPGKYRDIGARTPKGVILYGPPGTGKTLLAKAIAGEADVPFFSACGSDFIEKYVGVGAKRVRELYEKAKRSAPCIVFIDEIDAIAAKRGSDENSERDQTINAMLAELDGFDANTDVITICATNRLELLDDAFQRAGRFDLKLAVGLPDRTARERILEIHGRNKRFSDSVSLRALARKCVGFSGADLEALLNESAMQAVGRGHTFIDPEDLDGAFFKIVMKGNRKPRTDITETNRIVAWHEAGHTLATKLLTDDSVPSVTIVGSSSGAGGVTFRAPNEDVLKSRKYLRDMISVMYAGRAAEEIYLGDGDLITTGASQDIKQATGLIKEYLGTYGMGRMGMIDMSQFDRDGKSVLDESAEMAKSIYEKTVQLLRDNKDKLERLASGLLDKETLDEAEIDALIAA